MRLYDMTAVRKADVIVERRFQYCLLVLDIETIAFRQQDNAVGHKIPNLSHNESILATSCASFLIGIPHSL